MAASEGAVFAVAFVQADRIRDGRMLRSPRRLATCTNRRPSTRNARVEESATKSALWARESLLYLYRGPVQIRACRTFRKPL